MRRLIITAVSPLIFLSYSGLAFAQVQDLKVSVEQFNRINKAKSDVKKIKKGVTVESEIAKMFGKESALLFPEERSIKEDEAKFKDYLQKHISADLKPEYPFPNVNQKVLIYIIPWVFEHTVPGPKGEGEYVQSENLVLLVTINKKTGIVDDSKSFDFTFYQKWEGSKL